MMTPDRKVRKLMEEYQKTGNLSKAALRSDLDPKAVLGVVEGEKLPVHGVAHCGAFRNRFEV